MPDGMMLRQPADEVVERVEVGGAPMALPTSGKKPKKLKTVKVADLFCGAGGTSSGMMRAAKALGLDYDLVCVNHWPTAIATHSKNHPKARHYCQDLAAVRPEEAVPEGMLDLLTASPTCTFHSRARGGKPTTDQQRMDPWHVVTWIHSLRVKRLLIENVPEFVEWGPISLVDGKPIPSRKGEYFRNWLRALRGAGFKVEWRIVVCADLGDATTRTRFFLMGRSDGKKIRWPEAEYSKDGVGDLFGTGAKKWRSARDHVIDWSLKGRSIFGRKIPLKPKTLRRIAAGVRKDGGPLAPSYLRMIAQLLRDTSYQKPKDEGLKLEIAAELETQAETLETAAAAGASVVILRNNCDVSSVDEPVPTLTAGGTHIGLSEYKAEPFIVNRHGENGSDRIHFTDEPMPTATCRGAGYLAVPESFMIGQHGGAVPRPVGDPVPTIAGAGAISLSTPSLIVVNHGDSSKGGRPPHSVDEPLPTVVATDSRFHLVETAAAGVDLSDPAVIEGLRAKRLVLINGVLHMLDISFRMLEPVELARAMSFDDEDYRYEFTGTKTEITKQIGNSVPVRTATALISALLSV